MSLLMQSATSQPFYIFDIDGTLANAEHRVHLINGDGPKRWDDFFALAYDDTLIEPVARVLEALSAEHGIVFVTGREETHRDLTVDWLCDKLDWPRDTIDELLAMRARGDRRPDYEVKAEWWDSLRDQQRANCLGVFEDRAQVVKMWREKGLRVFQVADGHY